MVASRGRRRRLSSLYADFSGGLNLRDAPSELAANETPAAFNVTLDERGGLAARLGISKLNAASLLPAAACYLYYSQVADALLAYIPTHGGVGKLYKSTDAGVTWSAAYVLFTTGAKGWIVDFKDRVVVGNNIDGVYSFPSSLAAPTHTAGGTNNMEVPKGSCGCVWQNKVLVAGISTAGQHARVYGCAPGDETTFTLATGFNDLREVDDQIITAIGPGQGIDSTTKPTCIVCKRNSTYRIDDSTTLAYVTLHSSGAGAASATSIASNLGEVCFVNDIGVWQTDGINIPARVSDKLAPLFTPTGLNTAAAQMDGWSAAPLRDRIVFNLSRAGSSTNNLQLEYHPQVGWFMPHKGMALGPCCVYTKSARKTMAVHVSSGAVYEVAKGGSDDGTAIACSWQSRWEILNRGALARLRRLRVWARGTFTAYIRVDFSQGAGDEYLVDLTGQSGGFVWGTGVWGVGVWGDAQYEGDTDLMLDEVGKYFALGISKTVSASASAPALLGDGSSLEIGDFAVYSLRLDHIPLGAG